MYQFNITSLIRVLLITTSNFIQNHFSSLQRLAVIILVSVGLNILYEVLNEHFNFPTLFGSKYFRFGRKQEVGSEISQKKR